MGIGAVEHAQDLHAVVPIVDAVHAVDGSVSAPWGDVPTVQGRPQLLAHSVRALREWADNDLVSG
jgi:hypothetical protein